MLPRFLLDGCAVQHIALLTVSRILVGDRDVELAVAGQSVTLTLADELDVNRGDVLAAAEAPPAVADQFEATIVWMHEQPMLQGRSYLMKIGTRTVTVTVSPLKYRVNVNTLEHVAAKKLELNDIGVCGIELDQPIAFEPYSENRDLGGFITRATWSPALLRRSWQSS